MGLLLGIRVRNEDGMCDIVSELLGTSVGFWLGWRDIEGT